MSGQGAMVGAAAGGIYGLASGKDPLKSAMIGAAVGATGGAAGIPGLASAGTAAGTAGAAGAAAGGAGALGATTAAGTAGAGGALTGAGASTAANTMFANAAGVNPGTVMGASQAAPAGIFSNFTAPIPQASNAVPRDIGFFESTFNPNIQSSSMAPSFMEQVGSGASQVGQYAQQNPVLTQMAMQTANQAMQQPEAQFAPAGQVSRGQIQGGDYMSLLNPQQGSVLRPQPISLLG
jgi:hypothetical protein